MIALFFTLAGAKSFLSQILGLIEIFSRKDFNNTILRSKVKTIALTFRCSAFKNDGMCFGNLMRKKEST